MLVKFESYGREHLVGMMGLYNDETAFERFISPLDPHAFLELVEKKSYFDADGLIVATSGTEVIGWVHACVAPGSESWHDPHENVARIQMLMFRRDRLKIGRALVHRATEWLRTCNPSEILAMHALKGFPFYRGVWLGSEPMCPVTLPHVQMALESCGYEITHDSVFMVADMQRQVPRTRAMVDIEFIERPARMTHEPMRQSWTGFEPVGSLALLDGQTVGRCGWVVLPRLPRLGVPCLSIWGLGVDEPHRRKGIASALVARAMRLAHDQGARFGSATAQLWNIPAHATYERLGFKPHCLLVGRTLSIKDKP